MSAGTIHATREAWLKAAVALMAPRFLEFGATFDPFVHVSVGFPRSKGKRKFIGQCWCGSQSADGAPHVFICPTQIDPLRILEILSHELVHAAVGCEHGHKKPFIALAKSLGHEKPWTATTASIGLNEVLQRYLDVLGEFPHSGLDPKSGPQLRKQTTRLRKYVCSGCDLKVRIAKDDANVQCLDCDIRLERAE